MKHPFRRYRLVYSISLLNKEISFIIEKKGLFFWGRPLGDHTFYSIDRAEHMIDYLERNYGKVAKTYTFSEDES